MIKKLVTVSMSTVLLIMLNANAYAADNDVKATKVENKVETPVPKHQLKTLFLDKPTRVKIDMQRQAYLKPSSAQKTPEILPKPTGKATKPKVKRIYIPPKVAVSAVVVKPDGSRLVRVNKKYNRSPSKHIDMDFAHSSTDGVPVTVQGRTKIVPVGSTLLTRKNKLVKTYKLEQNSRKVAVPKTKQVAVKQRLKQVQILKPEDRLRTQQAKELPAKEAMKQ